MSTDIKTCEDLLTFVDDIAENSMTTQQYKTIAEGIANIKKSFNEKQPQYCKVMYHRLEANFCEELDDYKIRQITNEGIFKIVKEHTPRDIERVSSYITTLPTFANSINITNEISESVVEQYLNPDPFSDGGYSQHITPNETVIILRIVKL